MRRRYIASIAAIGATLTLLALAVSPAGVQAQDSVSGSALRIAPVRSDLTIKPGESKTIDVYVTNVTDKPAQLRGIVNDFGPSDDETGQPRIYLDEKTSAPSRGLKKFIKPIGEIELQPQERKDIKVTISVPTNAAGGGYYGAVRFAPASSSSKENVSLSGSVGSLILVTVPGDVIEKAQISSFNVTRLNDGKPGKASNFFIKGGKDGNGKGIQIVLRIENTGNVQVAPFGKAILKKSGKEIATYEVNNSTPRGNVLPDSTRRFMIDMGDKTSSFGKYTVEGNFGYGNSGQLISAKTSFYVVPLAYLLVGAGLLLILIAALLILPRMLRSHDRSLIRKIRSHK